MLPGCPGPAARGHVLLVGGTGTIGRATLQALQQDGWRVSAMGRRAPGEVPFFPCAFDNEEAVSRALAAVGPIDAIVSCLASRTGRPRDAWAIDHDAHQHLLQAARRAGVRRFVLLSAICVQKPRLAFQHAKLAFERSLINSGLDYSIVRPTAFFKSLTGQLERVKAGKAFLVFGGGRLTACKPISDRDLAHFLVACLTEPSCRNAILPIGGPGPAVTPIEQAERLFAELGRPLRIRSVSPRLLDAIILVLAGLGRVFPALADRAELARIGRYYATESMLVWNEDRQAYDAQGTPETGLDTLFDFQAAVLRGEMRVERGDHAVF